MKESRPKAPKSRDSRRSNQRQEWPELGIGRIRVQHFLNNREKRTVYICMYNTMNGIGDRMLVHKSNKSTGVGLVGEAETWVVKIGI